MIMGVQLANVAMIRWAPHVTDRGFRVLMRMALVALDKPSNGQPAAHYFGGMELLAMSLRAERGGTVDTAHRTVRRALSELVSVGAVESVERGRRGKRAVYRLTLDADPKVENAGLQSPPNWTPESPYNEVSGLQSPNSGPLVSSLGATGSYSREDLPEDESVTSQGDLTSAREPSPIESESPSVEMTQHDDDCCQSCGVLLDPDGSCFNRFCPALRSVTA